MDEGNKYPLTIFYDEQAFRELHCLTNQIHKFYKFQPNLKPGGQFYQIERVTRLNSIEQPVVEVSLLTSFHNVQRNHH